MVQTRKPTGASPWPLILLEGGEKSGKRWACAQLTASSKVGRAFWLDIVGGFADEYGALPGADYEIVLHDGTFASIYAAVADIHAIAAEVPPGEPPVVLILDGMTAEWELLRDWAADRTKNSHRNRRLLARDPNAEITIPNNIWDDANARHRRLMRLLLTFPGICVMLARGKFAAAVDENGRLIPGAKEYRVEAQRTVPFDASVWIRLSRDEPPAVVGWRSVRTGVQSGRDALLAPPEDRILEWVVFDALGCDPASAQSRALVDRKSEPTPEQIRAEVLNPTTTVERLRELHELTQILGFENVLVTDGWGNEGALGDLIRSVATQRKQASNTSGGNDRKARKGNSGPGTPPRATPAQRDMLADLFTKVGGFEDPDSRATYLAEVLGRPVTEDELTVPDAEQVASRLREHLAKEGARR
ncbi:hypothetical protein ABZ801_01270 [Actinomadura sp. NPDC047616]|uniref:hypothetical protein n=1 Tax=Actinomadura sp. NPDC047616 TaxID=3155914 RepID=UPI0033D79F84